MGRAKDNPLDRPARLIKELSTAPSIAAAMRKAGYSDMYAKKQPGIALNSALERTTAAAIKEGKGIESARNIVENILGVSWQEYQNKKRELALNARNESISVQLLAAALKAEGLDISGDNTVQASQVNIIVSPQSTENGQSGTVFDIEPPAKGQELA